MPNLIEIDVVVKNVKVYNLQWTDRKKDPVGRNEEKEAVIEEIIMCEVDQVKDFCTKLE